MIVPPIRYAKSGDVSIAYQDIGEGPQTIVHAPGWISHVEIMWEDPTFGDFMGRLSSFARVLLFDKRGTGASDRDVGYPTLDDRMDDIRAVMDDAGVERAALFGASEGGNMACMFAAAYPERVSHLMLFGVFAKREWAPDYPWAPTLEEREAWIDMLQRSWGGPADMDGVVPSRAGDAAFAAWFGRFCRMSASPSAAVRLARLNTKIDVRDVLPAISAPALIMNRKGDRDAKVEEARYIAGRIPGARLVELEGADHLPWTGDIDDITGEIEEFVTGARAGGQSDLVLATILCTDIVGSTAKRTAMGDGPWQSLMQQHDAAVRAVIRRRQGVEINTTGDGFLISFASPARAIQAAFDIQDALRALDLPIRAGVHTGECRRAGEALSGVAIDICVRIASLASADQVFASRTVRDLTIGARYDFATRGEHALKGAPGAWEIFSIAPQRSARER
ncbi:MAG: adenylate/guanylate cyclase domain-containing protein [Hyphomonadaceae bacterium]